MISHLSGSWDGTQELLTERIQNLKMSKQTAKSSNVYDRRLSAEYDAMIDDLEDYCDNTANESNWNSKGAKQERFMAQEYECQRSNLAESKAFQSKSKAKAVSNYKVYRRSDSEPSDDEED